MSAPSIVLAIGGFDGSGGAGTLADARAIQLNGGYPCAIVTAITAQNSERVDRVHAVSAELIRSQLTSLVDDFHIASIKIGLIPSAEIVETLLETLNSGRLDCPIVIDPVTHSTSGSRLADQRAIDALFTDLVPLATLITPNIAEARDLTNTSIQNLEDAIVAGRQILELGCEHVLVKGGHLDIHRGTDIWCYREGNESIEPTELLEGTVRGTGCMLASAIASYLAQGHSMREAITSSKKFVSRVISECHQFGHGTPMTVAGIRHYQP